MTCGNCHTPKGPPAAIAGKDYSGGLSLRRAAVRRHRARTSRPTRRPASATGRDAEIKKAAARPACGRTACQLADDDADGLLSQSSPPATSTPSSPICASLKPVKQQGAGSDLQDRAAAPCFPGAEKPYTQADLDDKVKQRLLSRHHRPLHGMPHADRRAAAADFDNRSARAAANSPARGASRCRATSRRSKTTGIGDWTDAEIKTRDHPGQAQGRQPAQAADGLSATTPR